MNTKIFLDSGNPAETKQAKELLGFLDGQTTNPSLVAKNPHIQELKNQGVLNDQIIWEEYKKVGLAIHEIIPMVQFRQKFFQMLIRLMMR
jgi:transaldolase